MDRLLREIIDLLPVGVWVADRHGRVVRANRVSRQLGLVQGDDDEGPLIQCRAWRVASGEELALSEWGPARAIGERRVSEEVIRVQCTNGTRRTVVSTVAPLYDDEGQFSGAIAVLEDVTELSAARMLSEKRGSLLQTVLDLLPVGVLRFDPQGHVVEANPAARRFWGLDEHSPLPELGDFTAWDVATGEQVQPSEWASARALKGETVQDELLEIRAFNGAGRIIFNSAAPLCSEQAVPIGAVAVNQDVSSLYRTQQQLRTAVRDREQLLAFVAHDLRNPLAGVALLAATIEQLAREGADAAQIMTLATRVQERVLSIAGLVDDLLAISAGGMANISLLDLQKTLPARLVDEALEQACDLFAARDIRLSAHLPPDLPPVMGDAKRLQRVIGNLLDNALKHTEPGGEVTITAARQGGVLFSVSNTGPALSQEQMRAMFQPFWQAHRDRRGAGLGLSIARSIVEAHGGSIWAEALPGHRVSVKFELPRFELTRSAQASDTRQPA